MSTPSFDRYVGIDYSGAKTPTSRLRGLQVYVAEPGHEPVPEPPDGKPRNWCRKEVAHFLKDTVLGGERVLIGIDHGFSFPWSYFQRYQLTTWGLFLEDFSRHWPTDRDGITVQEARTANPGRPGCDGGGEGSNTELRLTEKWTSSAKSVFLFGVQGTVANSTHAGIPWLRFLRDQARERVFFWPFDGWQPPADRSVVAELYPSVFRNRYPREGRTVDEQDSYAVARWLEESDRRGFLDRYWHPPLTEHEQRIAEREGWILGIS